MREGKNQILQFGKILSSSVKYIEKKNFKINVNKKPFKLAKNPRKKPQN